MAEENIAEKFGRFEYIYMFVMIIYMSQATPETSRMVGTLSGNPIPFLIPIFLTYLLLKRHPVSFNNKALKYTLFVYTAWVGLQYYVGNLRTVSDFSFVFFQYYAIVIAYIHIKVYGHRFFDIFESCVVWFCKVAIVFWLISHLLPWLASGLFSMFPETSIGNSFFYIYTWIDPAKAPPDDGVSYALRNAGCAWEPGRFAVMVIFGLYTDLLRNGIRFRENGNVFVMLFALFTTFSTTGYVAAVVLYLLFYIKRIDTKYVIRTFFVLVALFYVSMNIDFIGDKIIAQLQFDDSEIEYQANYAEETMDEGEYAASLERFAAMYFEALNIVAAPFTGYGPNSEYSYFYQNISSHHVLTGQIMKLFGMFGIPFGLLLYYLLFRSSRCISRKSAYKGPYALFFIGVMSCISYVILSVPVFTAFWLFGLFGESVNDEMMEEQLEDSYTK